MNELKIFKHVEFGSVRVVVRNEKPWFVAKDVAEALGYKDTVSAILDHCKHAETLKGGKTPSLDNCPVLQAMHPQTKIINQADVLRLVVHSKLPAAEKVELWLFDEVGASVLEHGVYMTQQAAIDFIENPRELLRLVQAYADTKDKLKASENQVLALTEEKKQNEPKVALAEAVEGSDSTILIGLLAKFIKQSTGMDIGQNRLFKKLRELGYLHKGGFQYNLPTQKSFDLELLEVRKGFRKGDYGEKVVTHTTRVTGKGQTYFINMFKKIGEI